MELGRFEEGTRKRVGRPLSSDGNEMGGIGPRSNLIFSRMKELS